jgi:hypothetical protein
VTSKPFSTIDARPTNPRLLDIVHSDQKLYLVFEFLDMDLKKYMDTHGDNKTGLGPVIVKVSPLIFTRTV